MYIFTFVQFVCQPSLDISEKYTG